MSSLLRCRRPPRWLPLLARCTACSLPRVVFGPCRLLRMRMYRLWLCLCRCLFCTGSSSWRLCRRYCCWLGCCVEQLACLDRPLHTLCVCPPRVCLGRQQLHLLPPPDFHLLLLDRRRVEPHMPQPLVPHGRHHDATWVRASRVLDNAPHPLGRRRGLGPAVAEVIEFPVCVSLEILACSVSTVRRLLFLFLSSCFRVFSLSTDRLRFPSAMAVGWTSMCTMCSKMGIVLT